MSDETKDYRKVCRGCCRGKWNRIHNPHCSSCRKVISVRCEMTVTNIILLLLWITWMFSIYLRHKENMVNLEILKMLKDKEINNK